MEFARQLCLTRKVRSVAVHESVVAGVSVGRKPLVVAGNEAVAYNEFGGKRVIDYVTW
jgi:hypothetical protein